MATPDEIANFKLIVGGELFTDDQLGTVLDGHPDRPNAAAAQVWEIRAGRYHTMVNMAGSGSSRQMGDLHKNALAMAAWYTKRQQELDTPPAETTSGRSGTRRIIRA